MWKGLTKAEVKVLWNATNNYGDFARLIELKLKEKNYDSRDDSAGGSGASSGIRVGSDGSIG